MGTLDKYEYNLKLDQMKSLCAEENYTAAAEIADTINWNKVKNVNALVKAGEIYEQTEHYQEARNVLLMAYDRSPIGRTILYRLAIVAIKMSDFTAAQEYYDEFVQIAPHDNSRYMIQYTMKKAQGADYSELIPILEELNELEYTEEWAFELATLYHKAGMGDKCVEACDELILWFGEGSYVEDALELKMLYQPLSKSQEEKYRRFRKGHQGAVSGEPVAEEDVSDKIVFPQIVEADTKFNTVNLQEEIAKGMQQIISATEQGVVTDTMDNIKKMVEDIPYLQMHLGDTQRIVTKKKRDADAEIDGSLKTEFEEMLGDETADGDQQLSQEEISEESTGQMSIAGALDEWEKTRRAAEAALMAADQRKLESAKAAALQEAEDLMDKLNDVKPLLDAGVSPKTLLEEEYMQREEEEEPVDFESLRFDTKAEPEINPVLLGDSDAEQTEEMQEVVQGGSEGSEESGAEELAQGGTEGNVESGDFVLNGAEGTAESADRDFVQSGAEGFAESSDFVQGSVEGSTESGDFVLSGAEGTAEGIDEDFVQDGAVDNYAQGMDAEEPAQSEEPEEPVSDDAVESDDEAADEIAAEVEGMLAKLSPEPEEAEPEHPEDLFTEDMSDIPDIEGAEDLETASDSDYEDGDSDEEDEFSQDAMQGNDSETDEDGSGAGTDALNEFSSIRSIEDLQRALNVLETNVENKTQKMPSLEELMAAINSNKTAKGEVSDSEGTTKEEESKSQDSGSFSFFAKKKEPPITRMQDIFAQEEAKAEEEMDHEHLTDSQKAVFSYFVPVTGMENQLSHALGNISEHLQREETAHTGNLIIQGSKGCGKTVLATSMIRALQKETGKPNNKVGKIKASALNKKDIQLLLRKVQGGCLIIEQAGDLTKQSVLSLSLLLGQDNSGTLVILEDTSKGIRRALSLDEGFARKFTEKISIPIFTNDELVEFANAYSRELGYEIDELAVLALYNRISKIQRLDQETTLTEVKEIVDEAIKREANSGLRKFFGNLTAKRFSPDDRIFLQEKDFA